MVRSSLFLCLIGLALSACGPSYVKGTRVEYTAERQEVANVVERYRLAVEQRDSDALRALASRDYYENASTTDDPTDDYDYNGLTKVLADLKNTVKAVKLEIDMKDIQILGERAMVDYEFKSQYLYTVGETDKWATATDKNRLSFRLEDGRWRILGGM